MYTVLVPRRLLRAGGLVLFQAPADRRGRPVVYDRERRDRYGRWLAYVYLEREGRPDLFVNARLVSAGYARTLSIPPNTAHAAELAALERSAALAGRGLWSSCG